MDYIIVCPLAQKDIDAYYKGLNTLFRYINIKRVVVIGNTAVGEIIKQYGDDRVHFENEAQFISYDRIREIIRKYSDNNENAMRRTGWYLQQFLKFSYSNICEDEYYLLWDADTMPIHEHVMIEEGHPIFDMKSEHHEPYFKTFSRLFPNLGDRNKLSYISEHMLIKTSIMRELIQEIEMSDLPGDSWYEKIIYCIDKKDLPESGFADYETYGLYCLNKYPELYKERMWDSLRPASCYYKFEEVTEDEKKWLIKDYDALSFEAGWKYKRFVHFILSRKFLQKRIGCKQLLHLMHQFTI